MKPETAPCQRRFLEHTLIAVCWQFLRLSFIRRDRRLTQIEHFRHMEELLKTNDLVLISFVDAILKELDVGYFIADWAISALEGSIGILPRRVMVITEDMPRARRALIDAGLEAELAAPRGGLFPW